MHPITKYTASQNKHRKN